MSATMMGALGQIFSTLLLFWRSVGFFLCGGSYRNAPAWFQELKPHTKAHLFSLALIFRLWNEPHYRSGTFQQDMVKNLRNVAIPRTGIPVSAFCHNKISALAFVLVGYPLIALVAAVKAASVAHVSTGSCLSLVVSLFHEQLLAPRDWFSLWRLNCRLASYHSGKTKAVGYQMEDKWTFLKFAEDHDIPVSPCLKMPALCIKDRNEEGGMGINFFRNALNGGDWIIQERLDNDDFLNSMLPSNAPLSTFRVITASRGGGLDTASSCERFVALSCVFRAGRAGAATDHSSVLFDVDLKTGVMGKATTNAHWYKLGVQGLSSAWTSEKDTTHHPDCDVKITGMQVPDIKSMADLCTDAHSRMMPDVVMAGWDVAFTPQGKLLLEANLSCNFFRGAFDEDCYFGLVHEYFEWLDGDKDHESLLRQKLEQEEARSKISSNCPISEEAGIWETFPSKDRMAEYKMDDTSAKTDSSDASSESSWSN